MSTTTAKATIGRAFERFEKSVSPDDARVFHSTTLQDVRQAAIDIEKWQRERASLRNMRRIESFLKAIEKYSKVVEVLCNGTPFLPWIWAPIKLMLQLSAEYTSSFDKLLDAYVKIADAFPRFDRYNKVICEPDFQHVLALVYVDIVDFHRRAYKFFRRRAWKLLFDSFWKSFEARFETILDRLAYHRDLIDKEAVSFNILEAFENRRRNDDELKKAEQDIKISRFREVLTWLAVDDRMHEDDLDRLAQRRYPGTCAWVLETPLYKSWVEQTTKRSVIWLWGIPGSGKSVICGHIVQTLRTDRNALTLYYFCDSYGGDRNNCSHVLRSFATQLVRNDTDLANLVWQTTKGLANPASLQQLRKLIPDLITASPFTRIVIDGLDECDVKEHKYILDQVMQICNETKGNCTVLISSRDGGIISKKLRQKPTISLREQDAAVQNDIKLFVKGGFSQVRRDWDLQLSEETVQQIENTLIERSNGMFLWVELVLGSFQDLFAADDVLFALHTLPKTLADVYERIIDKILATEDPTRDKITRLLEWMTFAQRPMKLPEILNGVGLDPKRLGHAEPTTLSPNLIEYCKPLVEISKEGTVDFVHFSAKEYLLNPRSKFYMEPLASHLKITHSCVFYLNSTDLFLGTEREAERLIQLARNVRALHRYAIANWLEHLRAYSKLLSDRQQTPERDLCLRLERLCWITKPTDTETDTEYELHGNNLSDFKVWQKHASILHMIGLILAFEQVARNIEGNSVDLESIISRTLGQDPTFLSQIDTQYESDISKLLQFTDDELPAGIDASLISSFRSSHLDTVFFCRYSDCAQAIKGFETAEARMEHESSHMPKLECDMPGCPWIGIGFKRQRDQKLHKLKYHPEPLVPELTGDRGVAPQILLGFIPPPRPDVPPPHGRPRYLEGVNDFIVEGFSMSPGEGPTLLPDAVSPNAVDMDAAMQLTSLYTSSTTFQPPSINRDEPWNKPAGRSPVLREDVSQPRIKPINP